MFSKVFEVFEICENLEPKLIERNRKCRRIDESSQNGAADEIDNGSEIEKSHHEKNRTRHEREHVSEFWNAIGRVRTWNWPVFGPFEKLSDQSGRNGSWAFFVGV